MKEFERRVYAACAKIPKGKVSTYSAIARAIGKPGSARAVGNALNKNPHSFNLKTQDAKHKTLVPCHRVVRSDGSVGGYAHGTKAKIAILKKEGVKIVAGRVRLKKN
ncbi:MGMT family protein [Candidatus Micrarchaeota archaeon]|nr:MGMT family protein [Candidatus Micrarchaeota archaeon]